MTGKVAAVLSPRDGVLQWPLQNTLGIAPHKGGSLKKPQRPWVLVVAASLNRTPSAL